MSIIIPANTLATGGYEVDNSCRFNGDAYVHKAVVAGNQRTFTYSSWIKRSTLNNYDTFIGYAGTAGGGGGTNRGELIFVGDGDDTLRVGFNPGGSSWSNYTVSDKVFRDTSAWYNIVLKVNTTNGTNTERLKIFVNGVSQGLDGYPGQNFDTGFNVDGYVYHVGRSASGTGNFLKGYLAEAVFIDGTALDADSFGEFDEDSGIWKPIDVSGLTFGNNGFHLDFEASGNLGNDANGGTDFTEVSLAATDQSTDTCTNNFCTWNPLANYTNTLTFSEGNLKTVMSSQAWHSARGTFGFSSGKWYWECKLLGNQSNYTGVVDETAVMNTADAHTENGNTLFYNGSNGEMEVDGSQTSNNYGNFSETQVCGVAVDADNNKISIYKNGSAIVSNHSLSTTRTGFLFPTAASLDHSQEIPTGQDTNFGSPLYSESGGNSDGNGYGNFSQAVPSGYFALNTKNLAEYG